MCSYITCHFPDRQSHAQIRFDQILPLAPTTRALWVRDYTGQYNSFEFIMAIG